jgi:hypothetical protein
LAKTFTGDSIQDNELDSSSPNPFNNCSDSPPPTGPAAAATPSTEQIINNILGDLPDKEIYPVYKEGFIKRISPYASKECKINSRASAQQLSTVRDCNGNQKVDLGELISAYLYYQNQGANDDAAAIAKIPDLINVVKSQKINFLPVGEDHTKPPFTYSLALMKNLQKQGYKTIFAGEYVESAALNKFNKANVRDKGNKIDQERLNAVVKEFLNTDPNMNSYLGHAYNTPEKLNAFFSDLKKQGIPVYPLKGEDEYDPRSPIDAKMAKRIQEILISVQKENPQKKIVIVGSFGFFHIVDKRSGLPESLKERFIANNIDLEHGLLHFLNRYPLIKYVPSNFYLLYTRTKIPSDVVVHVK